MCRNVLAIHLLAASRVGSARRELTLCQAATSSYARLGRSSRGRAWLRGCSASCRCAARELRNRARLLLGRDAPPRRVRGGRRGGGRAARTATGRCGCTAASTCRTRWWRRAWSRLASARVGNIDALLEKSQIGRAKDGLPTEFRDRGVKADFTPWLCANTLRRAALLPPPEARTCALAI